jgi:Fe-S-cluster containining protein
MQIAKGARNPRAHLCKECVGWCCYRNIMRMPLTAEGEPDWSIFDEETDEVRNPGDVEFLRKNFKVVKKGKVLGELYDIVFTCIQYDVEKKTCLAYEERPVLCQRYVCDESEGLDEPPGQAIFWHTHEQMKKDGVI